MIGLTYKDTITIYDMAADGYGDESVQESAVVPCLFLQSTMFSHTSNADNITSDAHVYLDPENEFLKSRAYRIEGMLIKAGEFGEAEKDKWYRINVVRVGMDKLLTNNIDNVHCYLDKSRGIKEEVVS